MSVNPRLSVPTSNAIVENTTNYNNSTRTLTTPTGRTATSTYDVDTLLTTQSSTGTA